MERAAASPGPLVLTLRRLHRSRAAVVFGALLALFVAACLAAPLYASVVAGTSPDENHLTDSVTIDGRSQYVVSLEGIPIGPTWTRAYLLGADENGRDLAVRVLYGARTSMLIGLVAVTLTLLLAIPLALAAGYFRGRVDSVINRLLDLLWSFPVLLVGLLLASAITLRGIQIGPLTIAAASQLMPALVIGLVYVPYIARPLRAEVLALREQPFIESARAQGMGALRLMRTELLPHVWTTVLVLSPLLFANAVVLEAALSFLGGGVQPPTPSFGTLIQGGLTDVVLSPHLLLAPSIALTLLVLSLNGLAEELREALDPYRATDVEAVHGQ